MLSRSQISQPRRTHCHLASTKDHTAFRQLNSGRLNSKTLFIRPSSMSPVLQKVYCRLSTQKLNMRVDSSALSGAKKRPSKPSTQAPILSTCNYPSIAFRRSSSSLCSRPLFSEPSAVLTVPLETRPVAPKPLSRGCQHHPERNESSCHCGLRPSSEVVCPTRTPQQARAL